MRDPALELKELGGFEGARVLRSLPGGNASDSWLIDTSRGRAVLRLDRPLAQTLGLDRHAECSVLQAAQAAGLAPEPWRCDPDRGVLVTAWLPGRSWTAADLEADAQLVRLGSLLRKLHELPSAGSPFEPVRVAERYLTACAAETQGPLLAEVGALADELYPPGLERRTCHHDAHAGNVIEEPDHDGASSGRLRLIDWEYAAAGHPIFDFAVVVRYHGLDQRRAALLLEAGLAAAGAAEFEALDLAGRLYDLLAGAWERAVRARSSGPAGPLYD